jgi:two-component system, NtrC family, response regulator
MAVREAVLVIDDDSSCRELIAIIGQLWGIPVLEAADCAAGLRILQREKQIIRLILLDYFMPGMQPVDCAAALKALAEPAIPIILMTASVDPAARAAELELSHWISKPFDISVLEGLFKRAA